MQISSLGSNKSGRFALSTGSKSGEAKCVGVRCGTSFAVPKECNSIKKVQPTYLRVSDLLHEKNFISHGQIEMAKDKRKKYLITHFP